MTDYGQKRARPRLAAKLASVLAVAFVPLIASGQDEVKKRQVPFAGTQAFRAFILHQLKLEPLREMSDLDHVEPAQTLVIVLGDNSVLDDIKNRVGSLEKFTNTGGAMLIATDRDDGGRLAEWKLHITGAAVSDPGAAYKGLPACPVVVPEKGATHPVLNGVVTLATNRPSFVQSPNPDFQRLATFSASARVHGQPLPRDAAFLSATTERVLVLAGHSVFMNGMMGQRDNDNFKFARNCIDWLTGTGTRKYALLVEEGKVMTKFDVALSVPAPVPIPPVDVVNRLLSGLEEEDFFNRLLRRFFSQELILRAVLIFLSAVLMLWGSWRLLRGRYRIEASVPLLAPEPAAAVVELTVPAERQQAVLKGANFREAAQVLARFFFEEFTSVSPASGPRNRRPDTPPVAIHGGWWRRGARARELRYLWQLAYGDPGPISAKQFQQLPALLDRLAPAPRTKAP